MMNVKRTTNVSFALIHREVFKVRSSNQYSDGKMPNIQKQYKGNDQMF